MDNHIELKTIPASLDDYPIIQNMARFYVYDMSRYCGNLTGWECPSNGLYECTDFKNYFTESDRYPFLIKTANELVGFVLINKVGSHKDIDWNIGEFFILAKFQSNGRGKSVAHKIFDKFDGIWEVSAIPENIKAINCWRKIITECTKGDFKEEEKTLAANEYNTEPYNMVILQFKTKHNYK